MAHGDNHVASEFYIAQWAGGRGQVAVVTPPSLESILRKPTNVGYRRRFWGTDPELCRAAEDVAGRIERDAAPLWKALASRWPVTGRDRVVLAYFLSLHLWRNPYGRGRFIEFQRETLPRRVEGYSRDWTPRQVEEFLGLVTSQRFRAEVLFGMLPRVASLLASMHWTLVSFDQRLLATSDQPVTIVPLLAPGTRAKVLPLPRGPLLECQEVRIAVNPSKALVLTWHDEPDDGPPIRGDDPLAAQLNRAVIVQADRQWFHHPGRRPTSLLAPLIEAAPCSPIGGLVVSGYGHQSALSSRRRADTAANLRELVESASDDEVRVVSVRRHAA